MRNDVMATAEGLLKDPAFGLALIRRHAPELSWMPEDSLRAAEDAYCASFGSYPDYRALSTGGSGADAHSRHPY